MEDWLHIPYTNERYSVNRNGDVRANWRTVPRRGVDGQVKVEGSYNLRPYKHTNGYMRVSLGRGIQKYVHRIVAELFVPNPEGMPQVDHIDGNRTNNSADNLRWVSAKENSHYGGKRHEWISQKNAAKKRRKHDKMVEKYKQLRLEGKSFREIARMYNTSHSAISRALKVY